MANYRAKFTPQERKAFGERLRRIMLEKDMTGADVARAANKFLRKPTTRQLVSSWVSGESVPNETNLAAIERALNIPAGTLLMRDRRRASGEPAPNVGGQVANMTITANGKMHIALNAELPVEAGMKILEIIRQNGGQTS